MQGTSEIIRYLQVADDHALKARERLVSASEHDDFPDDDTREIVRWLLDGIDYFRSNVEVLQSRVRRHAAD